MADSKALPQLPDSPQFSTLELVKHDATLAAPEHDNAVVAPENDRTNDAPQVCDLFNTLTLS